MAHAGGLSAPTHMSAVTVVIPVWDGYVRFLAEAVASVREATPEAAIIVVDNSSDVEVPAHPGCSIVRTPERYSVGAARNFGLERVKTDYVLVLDADDRLLPGTLELLLERMDRDPGVSLCATAILDDETGRRHRTPRRFVRRFAARRRLFALADAIWSLVPIQGCALMRVVDVRAAGGYADASWGDDWVLAVSLAHRGRVELHEHLGRFYRSHPESISRQTRASADLATSARLVRERLRSDPAVSRMTKALLPLIAGLQLAAVYVARPVYLAARRLPLGSSG